MNEIETKDEQTFIRNREIEKKHDGKVFDEMEENETARRIRLRRDARRKRILENAKSRLEKLNGRASGDYLGAGFNEIDQNKEYSDPEVEPDTPEALTGSLLFANEANGPSLDDFNIHKAADCKTTIFIEYRLHVILASVITYICTIMYGDGSLVFSLFVPVTVCILSEKFFCNAQQQKFNPSMFLVATLAGMDVQKGGPLVFNFFRVIMLIQNLIIDFGIVIFCAVLSTYVLSKINDIFITLSK